jgi:hypothetical protein
MIPSKLSCIEGIPVPGVEFLDENEKKREDARFYSSLFTTHITYFK